MYISLWAGVLTPFDPHTRPTPHTHIVTYLHGTVERSSFPPSASSPSSCSCPPPSRLGGDRGCRLNASVVASAAAARSSSASYISTRGRLRGNGEEGEEGDGNDGDGIVCVQLLVPAVGRSNGVWLRLLLACYYVPVSWCMGKGAMR